MPFGGLRRPSRGFSRIWGPPRRARGARCRLARRVRRAGRERAIFGIQHLLKGGARLHSRRHCRYAEEEEGRRKEGGGTGASPWRLFGCSSSSAPCLWSSSSPAFASPVPRVSPWPPPLPSQPSRGPIFRSSRPGNLTACAVRQTCRLPQSGYLNPASPAVPPLPRSPSCRQRRGEASSGGGEELRTGDDGRLPLLHRGSEATRACAERTSDHRARPVATGQLLEGTRIPASRRRAPSWARRKTCPE